MIIDFDIVIILVSSVLAALTFIGITLPLLQRTEKKDHASKIIKQRRQDLYEETKTTPNKVVRTEDSGSSVETFFKVQKMVGGMASNVREQMLQAGYRDPKAPLVFMIARFVLPLIFILLAMMFMSKAEEDLASGTKLMIFLGVSVFGFLLPRILVKNQIIKRQQEINQSFPDALDMILVCVQGGIGIEQAIARISEEVAEHSPTLAEEMGILSAELGLLNDKREAFGGFARRVGSGAAKSFGTAMIQAEKYGTSVSQAIRVMADELRDMRMAEAERKAASLPPKLTVPMIAFFLPALFVVILGPAVIDMMAG